MSFPLRIGDPCRTELLKDNSRTINCLEKEYTFYNIIPEELSLSALIVIRLIPQAIFLPRPTLKSANLFQSSN